MPIVQQVAEQSRTTFDSDSKAFRWQRVTRRAAPHCGLVFAISWYDMGEFDFSALQKIPRPTMNGLTLYVQGDVEVDKIEIKRKHE